LTLLAAKMALVALLRPRLKECTRLSAFKFSSRLKNGAFQIETAISTPVDVHNLGVRGVLSLPPKTARFCFLKED
jgi:hypothetical protein